MTVKQKKANKLKKTTNKNQVKGWLSTDEDEIQRRHRRAQVQDFAIQNIEKVWEFFGTFTVNSTSGLEYYVEIRSLTERINSCDCPDHRVNGLGTCKHIEAVLLFLQNRRKRRFREAGLSGSPRVEIFLDMGGRIRLVWPLKLSAKSAVRQHLTPYFSEGGLLLGNVADAIPSIKRSVAQVNRRCKTSVRLSRHVGPWFEELCRRQNLINSRALFERDVAKGKRSLDILKLPLYSYQQQGMLHLVFTARALLADEMGLGKTVQAVAACELLRRLHGIERVLVVTPVSLKTEWEEQLRKFSQLQCKVIQGARPNRLKQYREAAFFNLVNYEQIRSDYNEINRILLPDVVILDEAQRIKNWRTKTAISVKQLKSPYAFVLTGTPIENRIDEIYSIVQFLDPALFGPLFRFNREFYQMNELGQAVGYKNLDRLHRRLRPLMLRRSKEEVEGELPGRTVNIYYTSMVKEQSQRYVEYEEYTARLAAQAKKRPLTKEEMERLQKWLACMRMLCDTPYILDPKVRVSPKIDELENILNDLMASGDHKIIIFSEWERMLELVKDLAEDLGLKYAWHTGSTAQKQRRIEINRFKDEPDCILFLSTDAGSLGLNLQIANVVINMDLPWNPAKLEQRIARAWRKHQKNHVQVIHLVCEGTIEHKMLHLLDEKQNMVKGVVEGNAEFSEMALPSGRAAFLERLEDLTGHAVATPMPKAAKQPPIEQLKEDVLARWVDRLDLLEYHNTQEKNVLVVVADHVDDDLRRSLEEIVDTHSSHLPLELELLDRKTYNLIQRLVETGVLNTGRTVETLHRSSVAKNPELHLRQRRLTESRSRFEHAQHKRRMAQVLADGGFVIEAIQPLTEAVEIALQALAHIVHSWENQDVSVAFIEHNLIKHGLLPEECKSQVMQFRVGADNEETAKKLVIDSRYFFDQVTNTLEYYDVQKLY